jgi:peptidoglycan/xylan/chitin deacetylase (PgdA/CDA1 family)
MKSIWLTYHDIYGKEPAPWLPRSAAMYHVSRDLFAQHLLAIKTSGRRVITAGEYLNDGDSDSVIVTFDDGWRGALEMAVPMLKEFGFQATFFITQDFVGRQGFCDQHLILEAAKAGMEIGVHGRTHRMLSSCSREEVIWELSTCKEFLESLLRQQIVSSSMPGGDWSEEIAACAKEVGLETLCTSRPGVNGLDASLFNLSRVSIRESTSASDIRRYCGYNVQKESLRWAILQLPRLVLGMKRYSLLRRRLLGEKQGMKGELFNP